MTIQHCVDKHDVWGGISRKPLRQSLCSKGPPIENCQWESNGHVLDDVAYAGLFTWNRLHIGTPLPKTTKLFGTIEKQQI